MRIHCTHLIHAKAQSHHFECPHLTFCAQRSCEQCCKTPLHQQLLHVSASLVMHLVLIQLCILLHCTSDSRERWLGQQQQTFTSHSYSTHPAVDYVKLSAVQKLCRPKLEHSQATMHGICFALPNACQTCIPCLGLHPYRGNLMYPACKVSFMTIMLAEAQLTVSFQGCIVYAHPVAVIYGANSLSMKVRAACCRCKGGCMQW